MEQADMLADRVERGYERYGWVILLASAILGIFDAVVTTLPPLSWFWNPLFQSEYPILGAWGITWAGLNIFALVMVLIPFRRNERWAWYTLWLLPLLWLSLFVLAPYLPLYLVLTIITALGLILPHRRFFARPEEGAV